MPNCYLKHVEERKSTFDYFASDETRLRTWKVWLYTALAAVAIGCIKGFATWIAKQLWTVRTNEMAELANEYDHSVLVPMTVYMSYALVFGLITAFAILQWAPAAAGGGIPDMKAFLNGNEVPGFLARRTLIGRIIGVTLVNSCGMLVGPEGPLAHVGVLVAVLVGTYFFTHKLTDRQIYDFAAVGSGMGVSAAFTAPLTGSLFALEEAASYWHPELISRAFFGGLIAAIVGSFASAGFECEDPDYCISIRGEYALTPTAEQTYTFKFWEIPLFIFTGVISGIISLGISYGIISVQKVRLSKVLYKHPRIGKWIRVLDVGVVFALTAIGLSLATFAVDCVPFNDSSVFLSSALCAAPNQANPISLLLLEPRLSSIKSLVNGGGVVYTQSVLWIAGLCATLATIFSNGLSVPAGLFVPMVLIGSIFGRLSGIWMQMVTGDGSVRPGIYAVAGGAGVLAGVSRMTIWIAVVVVEGAGDTNLVIPIMTTVIVSKWLADSIMPAALYERMAELAGHKSLPPCDDAEIEKVFGTGEVRDIMTSPVVCLFRAETRDVLRDVLSFAPHSVFPVLDENDRLVGCAKREDLKHLLEGEVAGGELVMPVTQSHVSVNINMSVRKCYYLFSQLGVKTVIVIDVMNRVAGVLTRTNFLAKLA